MNPQKQKEMQEAGLDAQEPVEGAEDDDDLLPTA